MWVSKNGNDSCSDGSGLFAIYMVYTQELSIYNFHKRLKIWLIQTPKPENIIFNPQINRFIMRLLNPDHLCV